MQLAKLKQKSKITPVNKQYLKDLDIGFRVLKVCDVEEAKPDIEHERYLYTVFMALEMKFSCKYEYKEYMGIRYFECIDDWIVLFCCMEESINDDFVQFVLEAKPRHFVFRSISYDHKKATDMQKRISEHTKIKLIYGE